VTKTLTGVFGPVITTFDARGELDLDAFGANATTHLEAGLHGLVVAGSTGEAALLEETERHRLVEMARSVTPDDKWVIAGTGAESTKACVRRCKEAAQRGADAVLVVAPHYYSNAMTPASLQAHYERVADESPLPVLLYNIPKYMHFRLDGELVARLAGHDNIVGMKDSSGDMAYFPNYIASQSEDFAVITGHGGTFATALQLGARGGILAVALFAPELSLEILRTFQAGQIEQSNEAQRRLFPLAIEIVGRMGIPAVKAAMERTGLKGGPVRLPLLAASAADIADVERLLRDAALAGIA
jgi:4-hydroxy-2-oxoglutarate aldolase